MDFAAEIIKWYSINKRDLPWRHTKNPYLIWLSEVILQQTRVQQGLPYYEKFVEHFPTVQHLAQATEQEVLNLWQGLGYYSRARNLHQAAKMVLEHFDGVFPTDYKALLSLKGIGTYTAAAIASFSTGAPHAVVDGNVYRVLSRYFGVETPINSPEGVKIFNELAQELLPIPKADIYNQAIMEFGAIQCKPKSPNCVTCSLQLKCVALKQNKISELPIKIKKIKVKQRFFNYLICIQEDKILLNKRIHADIWKSMYDFPLIETENREISEKKLIALIKNKYLINSDIDVKSYQKSQSHKLTHQTILINFFVVSFQKTNFIVTNEMKWVKIQDLRQFPVPKPIDEVLKRLFKT